MAPGVGPSGGEHQNHPMWLDASDLGEICGKIYGKSEEIDGKSKEIYGKWNI